MIVVRLTQAQESALGCAGARLTCDVPADDIERGEVALAAAWIDGRLEFEESDREWIRAAVVELANNEDDVAEDRNRAADSRRFARGARTALSNLAGKIG